MSIHINDLHNIDVSSESTGERLKPTHPGAHLAEILSELGITQYRLAKAVGVSQRRIGEIVHGKRAITADTALRLSRALGTTAEFWINAQAHYDLERERERLADTLPSLQSLVA